MFQLPQHFEPRNRHALDQKDEQQVPSLVEKEEEVQTQVQRAGQRGGTGQSEHTPAAGRTRTGLVPLQRVFLLVHLRHLLHHGLQVVLTTHPALGGRPRGGMGHDDAREAGRAGHFSAGRHVQGPDIVGRCIEYYEKCEPVEF